MAIINQDELRTLTDFPTLDPEDSLASSVEGDATCVLSYDSNLVSYTDYTTEFNDANADDFPLFPVTPQAAVDLVYIGADNPFRAVRFITGIAGVGNYYFVWHYWNGSAWVELVNMSADYDYCKGISDKILSWIPVSDWATVVVDGNTKYWIQTTFQNTMSTVPVISQGGLFFDTRALSKSVSDTLNMSDSVSLEPGKVVADVLSLGDTISLAAGKIVSDTFALSDSIALESSISRTFADSFSISDNINVTVGLPLILSDSFNISDSIVKELNKIVSDGVPLADDLVLAIGKVFTDGISITDAISVVLGLNLTLGDTFPISDSMALYSGLTLSLADIQNISDDIVLGSGKLLSDALTISDSKILGVTKNIADSLGISDSGLVFDVGKNVSDSQPISDLAITFNIGKSVSDIVSIADSIFKALVIGIQLPGLKDIAKTLAEPFNESSAWMTYVAIGDSPIEEDEINDTALWSELYRKEGTVWAVRNTFFVKATFGQDEPNADDITIREIGIFDDPDVGTLGRRWVLDAPVTKDNIDEIVIECAVTFLHGTIGVAEIDPSALVDSFGITDSIAFAFGRNLDLSDSLSISDSVSFALGRELSFSDSLVISDGLSTVLTPGGDVVDALYVNNIVYKNGDHVICNVGYKIGGVYQGSAIMSIDVSNPLSPVVANYVPISQVTHGYIDYESVLRGDYLYFAMNNAFAERGGLSIWDVSDPSTPSLSGELRIVEPVPGVDVQETYSYRIDVNQAGTRAGITTNIFEGFVIADVSDKAVPVEIDRGRPDYYDSVEVPPGSGLFYSEWKEPGGQPPTTWMFRSGGAGCKFTDGDSRISVTAGGEVWNLDVGNLSNDPNWIRDTTHASHALEVNGTTHYMLGSGDYPNNLQISSNSVGRGQCFVSISGTAIANGIVYNNDYLYVTKGLDLSIVDVSDPDNPSVVATTGHYAKQQVAFNGNYMFVAAASQGLRIYDITDPTSPVLLTQFLPY